MYYMQLKLTSTAKVSADVCMRDGMIYIFTWGGFFVIDSRCLCLRQCVYESEHQLPVRAILFFSLSFTAVDSRRAYLGTNLCDLVCHNIRAGGVGDTKYLEPLPSRTNRRLHLGLELSLAMFYILMTPTSTEML